MKSRKCSKTLVWIALHAALGDPTDKSFYLSPFPVSVCRLNSSPIASPGRAEKPRGRLERWQNAGNWNNLEGRSSLARGTRLETRKTLARRRLDRKEEEQSLEMRERFGLGFPTRS